MYLTDPISLQKETHDTDAGGSACVSAWCGWVALLVQEHSCACCYDVEMSAHVRVSHPGILLMCVWPCAELPDAVHQLRERVGAAAAGLPQRAACLKDPAAPFASPTERRIQSLVRASAVLTSPSLVVHSGKPHIEDFAGRLLGKAGYPPAHALGSCAHLPLCRWQFEFLHGGRR